MDINPNFNAQAYYTTNDAFASDAAGKSRGIAALLAIFLGGLGIHYFYLGKTTPGIVFLVATLITCGFLGALTGIVALIQGILMFCMDNKTFDEKYVFTQSSFPLF